MLLSFFLYWAASLKLRCFAPADVLAMVWAATYFSGLSFSLTQDALSWPFVYISNTSEQRLKTYNIANSKQPPWRQLQTCSQSTQGQREQQQKIVLSWNKRWLEVGSENAEPLCIPTSMSDGVVPARLRLSLLSASIWVRPCVIHVDVESQPAVGEFKSITTLRTWSSQTQHLEHEALQPNTLEHEALQPNT